MRLLAEGDFHCPAEGSLKEAVTQLEVTFSCFKVNCARISCVIMTLKQSVGEALHLS